MNINNNISNDINNNMDNNITDTYFIFQVLFITTHTHLTTLSHKYENLLYFLGLVNNWPAVSDINYKWVTGKRFQEVDKQCFVPVEIGMNIAYISFCFFIFY